MTDSTLLLVLEETGQIVCVVTCLINTEAVQIVKYDILLSSLVEACQKLLRIYM